MIIGVVFWMLVVYGLFVFISIMVMHGSAPIGQNENPLDILKKRYARGEINEESTAARQRARVARIVYDVRPEVVKKLDMPDCDVVACRVYRMTSRFKSDRGSSAVHPRSAREA